MRTVSLVSCWNCDQTGYAHSFQGKHVDQLCSGRLRWPWSTVGMHCCVKSSTADVEGGSGGTGATRVRERDKSTKNGWVV